MAKGILWTQQDRHGNDIYLTAERWEHVIDPDNHPDIESYLEYVRETVRNGSRKQIPLRPDTYIYSQEFDDLPDFQTHVVAVVIFRRTESVEGQPVEENFVVTAYLKEID